MILLIILLISIWIIGFVPTMLLFASFMTFGFIFYVVKGVFTKSDFEKEVDVQDKEVK